ncbi:MAG: acyltransferase [Pseudomonadota bacterium]
MGYLSREALDAMGFASLGANVRISDKAAIYDAPLIRLGDNCRVDDFSTLSGRVTMGRNVMISALCHVAGGMPGVDLADFATLAYGVKFMSQSDDYTGATMTGPTVPAAYKREIKARSALGRHVIVGTNSVILPGVEVAEGCAIGAMSLVTRSTEPWGIYAGCPARRLRDRRQDLLALEQAYLAAEGAA